MNPKFTLPAAWLADISRRHMTPLPGMRHPALLLAVMVLLAASAYLLLPSVDVASSLHHRGTGRVAAYPLKGYA